MSCGGCRLGGASILRSDVHRLERLADPGAVPAFDDVLPTQWWYRDAGGLVLLTAVFERTRWRYEGPRAYRAVLIEAGHVCQTFCLTATWLGLAPFCSMALADMHDAAGVAGEKSCSTRPRRQPAGGSTATARSHPYAPTNDNVITESFEAFMTPTSAVQMVDARLIALVRTWVGCQQLGLLRG